MICMAYCGILFKTLIKYIVFWCTEADMYDDVMIMMLMVHRLRSLSSLTISHNFLPLLPGSQQTPKRPLWSWPFAHSLPVSWGLQPSQQRNRARNCCILEAVFTWNIQVRRLQKKWLEDALEAQSPSLVCLFMINIFRIDFWWSVLRHVWCQNMDSLSMSIYPLKGRPKDSDRSTHWSCREECREYSWSTFFELISDDLFYDTYDVRIWILFPCQSIP